MTGIVEVVDPGPLTTVQDLGRPGHGGWGVSPSGAADRGALRLANRLVGNDETAAALEATMGGLRVRADVDLQVALTGARAPARIDDRPVDHLTALRLARGATLELGSPAAGLRTYLGVRGGIDAEPVLGSRSTDVLAGLGPAALVAGHRLAVGRPTGRLPVLDLAPWPDPPGGEVTLRVRLGPRDDWFTAAARTELGTRSWTVTSQSNRVGLRLDGPPLARARTGELPTEGMVRGGLQVPPTGLPTLFLADHPVTGGYPVIAVVLDADLDATGQLRPGQQVRFRPL
ncbi:biotin-dependent carboxyltransferase family protein [Egicoccus sp. AB-alg6-2]|uniref:5-oxoprolinase subunit C family protein n=1 Tax=Egicoccus sp. AB-alg6-2 TaxID=3242692 RepID=UPI00359CDF12